MANTQSMCTTFLSELMTATHNFGTSPIRGASTADTFKAALYVTTATVDANTSVYSATNEVSGSGYSAGGVTVTNAGLSLPEKRVPSDKVPDQGACPVKAILNTVGEPAHTMAFPLIKAVGLFAVHFANSVTFPDNV